MVAIKTGPYVPKLGFRGGGAGAGRARNRSRHAFRLGKDSGSQKVQHYLDVISYKIKAVAPLAMRTSKYSPDSERAPGARSIAVEF